MGSFVLFRGPRLASDLSTLALRPSNLILMTKLEAPSFWLKKWKEKHLVRVDHCGQSYNWSTVVNSDLYCRQFSNQCLGTIVNCDHRAFIRLATVVVVQLTEWPPLIPVGTGSNTSFGAFKSILGFILDKEKGPKDLPRTLLSWAISLPPSYLIIEFCYT